ncbi:ferredoxin [Candidatus Roizmanbacteria bacterium]|nr:ferredoxin [Candidatus Roizmanbacteria bacterium]
MSDTKVIRKLKVTVNRDLCIGTATCVAIAHNTFNLDSESKAVVLETADQDNDETILEAARGCPVAAITVEDENGQKIYPA